MSVAATKEEGLLRVRDLVRRFAEQRTYYVSAEYGEAATRDNFLNPLLEALGWDVSDSQGLGAFREVVVENTVRTASSLAGLDDWDDDLSAEELAERNPRTSRPDYVLRLPREAAFPVEAKKPVVDLRGKAPCYQIKSYAWNLETPIGVVTNFRQLRVFDATRRPEYRRPAEGILRDLGFEEYEAEWDWLWDTLSRDRVGGGSIRRLSLAVRRRGQAGALSVGAAFLAELESWREKLASDLMAHNHGLDRWQLAEATQRILDRVVFLRVCEDRQVEPTVVLRRFARMNDSYRHACQEFRRLDVVYNGILFHEHWSERLELSDEVFQRLVESLYFPASPYRFDVIGADVLGSIYERFLGKELEIGQDGGIKLVPKPEARHAGGIYYTPSWVVSFIVERTVAPLLDEKTPLAAANLRIIDPSCGSGAFLLGAFDYLIRWHERYYTTNPGQSTDRHYEAPDGTRRLTSDAKADILARNLYGVDIDPQAVEVTQMSLYLKVLEGEDRATLTQHHRLFQTAFLPSLDRNIRCGNSLLGTDDVDAQVLFDTDLVRRVNPFDWWDERDGFGTVFVERGGFDAVIGNPPYTRVQELKRYRPEETAVYASKYASAGAGSFDIAAPFVERGMSLLRTRSEPGRLGLIVTRQFCEAEYGRPLRELLASGGHVEEIVDFRDGTVFEEASAYTLILIASAARRRAWQLTRVVPPPTGLATAKALADPLLSAERGATLLSGDQWDLTLPAEDDLLDRLDASYRSLGEVTGGRVFQGVITGADFVFRLTDHGPDPRRPGCRLVSPRESEEPPVSMEDALLRPVYAGRTDIRRFATAESSEALLLPYWRESRDQKYALMTPSRLRTDFPGAYAWLLANQSELRGRAGDWSDLNWYAYSRRQNLELFEEEKVLVPYMVEDLCAHYDNGGHWFVNVSTGGYGIPTSAVDDPAFLTALLSSHLLSWVLARRSRSWRGGWYAARKGNLIRLPIAEPDETTRANVVHLFERCVEATTRVAVGKTGHDSEMTRRVQSSVIAQFDQAVCDLYDLTDVERAVLAT